MNAAQPALHARVDTATGKRLVLVAGRFGGIQCALTLLDPDADFESSDGFGAVHDGAVDVLGRGVE